MDGFSLLQVVGAFLMGMGAGGIIEGYLGRRRLGSPRGNHTWSVTGEDV